MRVSSNNNCWPANRSMQAILSATFIRNTGYFWSSIRQRDLIFGHSIRSPGFSEPLTFANDPRTKVSSRSAPNFLSFVSSRDRDWDFHVLNRKQSTIAVLILTFIFVWIRKIWIDHKLFANGLSQFSRFTLNLSNILGLSHFSN